MNEKTSETKRLLQGVAVPFRTGCSLRSFLCDQLSIDDEYVERRITTIFLNGKVVDSLDETILLDGAQLALSAALPGLVGATMRRNGAYSAMRASISQSGVPPVEPEAEGWGTITVKLFNLLIEELGPLILRHANERNQEHQE